MLRKISLTLALLLALGCAGCGGGEGGASPSPEAAGGEETSAAPEESVAPEASPVEESAEAPAGEELAAETEGEAETPETTPESYPARVTYDEQGESGEMPWLLQKPLSALLSALWQNGGGEAGLNAYPLEGEALLELQSSYIYLYAWQFQPYEQGEEETYAVMDRSEVDALLSLAFGEEADFDAVQAAAGEYAFREEDGKVYFHDSDGPVWFVFYLDEGQEEGSYIFSFDADMEEEILSGTAVVTCREDTEANPYGVVITDVEAGLVADTGMGYDVAEAVESDAPSSASADGEAEGD